MNKRNYVSLHNHTIASIGDSTIKPLQLFEKTLELKQGAVAVTDHGTFAGIWDSYKASKQTGVKLIVGIEAYFVDDINDENKRLNHLILLAKNLKGYQNLLSMNKEGFDNKIVSFKKSFSRIDWNSIKKYSEGIICTSACGNGVVSQFIMNDDMNGAMDAAKRLYDIFGDDFALELQPHNLQRKSNPYSGSINQQKINIALKKISEKLNIKCIVTTDAHYVLKDHSEAHDVYLCISSGQPINSGQRLKYDKSEFYIKNSDEVASYFEQHEDFWGKEFIDSLFNNTIYFSDKCEEPQWINPEFITNEKSQLPIFPYKKEEDYEDFKKWKRDNETKESISFFWNSNVSEDAQFYRYRTEKGLVKKIEEKKIPKEDLDYCIENIIEEFDVFEYRNFSSYMLISADFLNWCRKNKIPVGPGRGSVGGSLTAYVNGIHQAYPKKYGLIFARFLNKYKASPPDIDNDIAPSGRDKLHNYLREKYGSDCVAHVSNINTITSKVYVRDISRVFEFGGGRSEAAEIGDQIANSISSDIKTIKQALSECPLFHEYAKQYPQIEKYASIIGGLPRAWATHAGGIVISKNKLTGLVPVRKDVSGSLVLEYEKERAEENGLVKIDTLGLETLDIIGETYEIIKSLGKKIPDENFDYEIADEKVYNLISEGNTFGVFQLGGTAVHVCKKIKPKNIEDLAVISSLVRPSSKDSIPKVIEIRDGKAEIKIPHESLNRSFKNTYGIGLFEESLLFLAQDFANWDMYEADKLRKMTKEKGKNPEKVEKWKNEFIEGAIKNGFEKEFAEKIWTDYVESFGGYGFNRSHATLYSMISFHTAYLKALYPLEFYVANLMSEIRSNSKSSKENIIKIKNEIREMNIKIVPPDVNTSSESYKIIDNKTLMTGLDSLKYMGSDAIPEIINKRPYKSFQDLIYKTDSLKVKAQSIQALAASGSLDCFNLDRHLMFYYASDFRLKLRNHMQKMEKEVFKKFVKNNENIIKKKIDKKTIYQYKNGSLVDNIIPNEEDIIEHYNKFNYPFPNLKKWTILEIFAMEEFYMGEGMTGTLFERYDNFFKRESIVPFEILSNIFKWNGSFEDIVSIRKVNTHNIYSKNINPLSGVIISMFSFIVKKEDSKIFGQEMARIIVQDPYNSNLDLIFFPDSWTNFKNKVENKWKQKLEPGLAINFDGSFQWENENTYSFIVNEVFSCKPPPTVPKDRKSKKIKSSNAKKVSSEEIENLNEDELLEKLENEVLDFGISPIGEEEDIFQNDF